MECGAEGCYSIVYSSTASIEFGEPHLLRLLAQARHLHQQANVTGVLMYGGGRFLQVLEGSPAAVRYVYGIIAADPRHGCFELLADGPIAQRDFKSWHMSFAPPPARGWQGLLNYLTPPQLVLAGLGAATQPVLSEFLAASTAPHLL